MKTDSEDQRQMRRVGISISGADWQLEAQVAVPVGPTEVSELLPLARALSDAIVGETVKAVEQSGERISCKKGCGACCRHLVAISEVEARRLRQVVKEMPEARRSEIRARFVKAIEQLEEAGLLQQLRQTEQLAGPAYISTSAAYFDQHLACPFLEDESCSIYTERPITCREYMVTSPAERCTQPIANEISIVNMPLRVFNSVARWQVPPSTHSLERWVPLILALEWAEAHPSDPPPQPGTELLRELIENLASREEISEAVTAPKPPAM